MGLKDYIVWPVKSTVRESYCRRVSGFLGYSHLVLGICNVIAVVVTAVISENAGVPEGEELLETAYVQCIGVWLIGLIGLVAHLLSYRVNYPTELPQPDHWLRFFKVYVFMMFVSAFLGGASVFHAGAALEGLFRYGTAASTSAMVFGLFHIAVQIGLSVRTGEILALAENRGFDVRERMGSPNVAAVQTSNGDQNLGTGSSQFPNSGANLPNLPQPTPDYSYSAVRFNINTEGVDIAPVGPAAKPYSDDPPNYLDLFKS